MNKLDFNQLPILLTSICKLTMETKHIIFNGLTRTAIEYPYFRRLNCY